MSLIKFEVIALDLWGNEEDGFEVNDLFKTGVYIEVEENSTDEALIDALKGVEVLADFATVDDISFDGDDYQLFVDEAATNRQLWQLHRVND